MELVRELLGIFLYPPGILATCAFALTGLLIGFARAHWTWWLAALAFLFVTARLYVHTFGHLLPEGAPFILTVLSAIITATLMLAGMRLGRSLTK